MDCTFLGIVQSNMVNNKSERWISRNSAFIAVSTVEEGTEGKQKASHFMRMTHWEMKSKHC